MRFLAVPALLHRIRRAMERNDLATGVDQRAGGLLDLRHQLVERTLAVAGHAQARDMRAHAGREGMDHLVFDHAVRGRNDEADARGHGVIPVLLFND